MEVSKSFTVKSTEAFSIKKVHLRHKNSTMFRESKNFYSFNLDDLRSKWIYPEKLEQKSEENYCTFTVALGSLWKISHYLSIH